MEGPLACSGRFRGPSGRAPFSDEGRFTFSEAPFEGTPSRRLERGFTFGRLQGDLKRLQGGFNGALRGLEGGFKGASRELEAFSAEGGFEGASRGLQGGLKGASP